MWLVDMFMHYLIFMACTGQLFMHAVEFSCTTNFLGMLAT